MSLYTVECIEQHGLRGSTLCDMGYSRQRFAPGELTLVDVFAKSDRYVLRIDARRKHSMLGQWVATLQSMFIQIRGIARFLVRFTVHNPPSLAKFALFVRRDECHSQGLSCSEIHPIRPFQQTLLKVRKCVVVDQRVKFSSSRAAVVVSVTLGPSFASSGMH